MDIECEENGVRLNISSTVQSQKKNEVVFCPDMYLNRSITLSCLAAYKEMGWCPNSPVRCLDAFGATGISGISWALKIPGVLVTINDSLPSAVEKIKYNAAANNVKIDVINEDVNILLHKKSFDFVFLDCYGSSVHYLDLAFKNTPKNGILIITSTDDAALYGKSPDMTLRNYNGHIIKTFYVRELAARLVIASVVRSAAHYNKGIDVLCCVGHKSFITVIVRILRGPAVATNCMKKISKVIHCCICEERSFYPLTVHPVEDPYLLLHCDCRTKSISKSAIDLGPVWSGDIFHPAFCQSMLHHCHSFNFAPKVISVIKTIVCEAIMEHKENENISGNQSGSLCKKLRTKESNGGGPVFYYNLHRHSPRGHDLGKINKIIEFLRKSGYRAARTHFDPEAIRTDASLSRLSELLLQFSCRTSV